MTRPRLPLILAGAAATVIIAVVPLLAHKPNPGWPISLAAMLAVYGLGLGLGRLVLGWRA